MRGTDHGYCSRIHAPSMLTGTVQLLTLCHERGILRLSFHPFAWNCLSNLVAAAAAPLSFYVFATIDKILLQLKRPRWASTYIILSSRRRLESIPIASQSDATAKRRDREGASCLDSNSMDRRHASHFPRAQDILRIHRRTLPRSGSAAVLSAILSRYRLLVLPRGEHS